MICKNGANRYRPETVPARKNTCNMYLKLIGDIAESAGENHFMKVCTALPDDSGHDMEKYSS
jgi:hypothetical protein